MKHARFFVVFFSKLVLLGEIHLFAGHDAG